jgi:mannose-1-phosphate guanylyltransferase
MPLKSSFSSFGPAFHESFPGQFLDSIALLGATATHPEAEYGWIEPGTPVPHRQ